MSEFYDKLQDPSCNDGRTTVNLKIGAGLTVNTVSGCDYLDVDAAANLGLTADGVTFGEADGGGGLEQDAGLTFDTATSLFTVPNVSVTDKLILADSSPITSTAITTTIPAASTNVEITSTTATDLLNLPNTSLSTGQVMTLFYVAEGAGGDIVTVGLLNATDGVGFSTITFNTLGDTATLEWRGTSWYILSVFNAVVA